jgi:hypothetical protein
MSSGAFEALACALLDNEPGVTRADLYGTPHQKQYGVDAFGETSAGLIVVSCKCYGLVRAGKTAEWSDDFLKHLEAHWRPRKVRKFILAVAAPMHSAQRLADVSAERARFEALGLEYDVWAPRQLQELLRDHPGLVSQYLGPEWEPRLCGRIGGTMRPAASSLDASTEDLAAQLAALREALSGAVEQQIEAAAQDLDNGRFAAITATLASIRAAPSWADLSPRARARTLRLQASLAINTGDVETAELLSREADQIQRQEEPRLQALIAMHRFGPASALEVLGTPSTDHGRTLRIGLLLNAGALDIAEAEIAALDSDDSEILRLRAFLHLLRGDPAAALVPITAAESKAPQRAAVRRLGAMVRYGLALSPKVQTETVVFPQPVARSLVKQDDVSQAYLGAAYQAFEQLSGADQVGTLGIDRVWALACLCNATGRSNEAALACRQLLSDVPTSALAIGWGLARGLDFDRSAALDAVKAAVAVGVEDLNILRALEWLAEDSEPAEVEAWLANVDHANWPQEQSTELSAIADRMRRRREGEGEAAEPTIAALDKARRTGDWSLVEAELSSLTLAGGTSPFLLAVAEELAGAGHWAVLADHVDTLARFETADAIRIAAFAAYNTGAPERALELLSNNFAFPGERLPFDLRRLEARALALTGSTPEALRRASVLAGETGALADHLLQSELRFSIGDIAGAAPGIRAALNDVNFPPVEALKWSERFVGEDPDLARALWRAAVANELSDELALGAVDLAFRLNVEHEQPALIGSLQRLARDRPDLVHTPTLDDLLELARKRIDRVSELEDIWLTGAAPVHVVMSALKGNLADLYYLEPPTWSPTRPLLVRHGGRGEDFGITLPFRSWSICLDITALLLAEQVGLLPIMDQLGVHVRVSPAMPAALLALEERSRPNQPSSVDAAKAVADAVADARIKVGAAPVDHTPVSHEPTVGSGAINLATALISLQQSGAVDADAATAARPIFGPLDPVGDPPAPGVSLVFEMGTLDLAAEAQVLNALLTAFDVWIDQSTAEHANAQVAHAKRGQALADWLADVRHLVRDRIESERWVLLPSAPRGEAQEEQAVEIDDALFATLLDAVRASDEPGQFLWVDDRHLSAYPKAGAATVVGVFDVLVRLRHDGILTDADYYARVRKLRAGGALFLPMAVAEVMHHVNAAPIVDGRLVETPGLAVLRRSVALALLHEDRLKIFEGPGPLAGRPNELPLILGLRRLAEGTVLDIWSSDSDAETAGARSDWAWFALRAEHLRRHQGPAVDARLFPALNIAGLAASSVHLAVLGARNTLARRRAFMSWLEEAVVGRRLDNDLALAEEAARMTAVLIQSAARPAGAETRDQRVQLFIRKLLRHTVALLPLSLRDRVAGNPQVRGLIQLRTPLVVRSAAAPFLPISFGRRCATPSDTERHICETPPVDASGSLVIAAHHLVPFDCLERFGQR